MSNVRHRNTFMRRQMNVEELDELYRSVGRCIWHVQYLEDVLHTLLTLKVEIRQPGRISIEEANILLAKHRRASLGTALGTAEKHKALPDGLLSKLRLLKEERDWLVHRSMNQDGEKLYTNEGRSAVFGRLETLMDETLAIKSLLSAEVAAFCAEHGVSAKEVEVAGRQKIARLKGG
jgi:hypothetical protein